MTEKKYNLDRDAKYLPPGREYSDAELIKDLKDPENLNLPQLANPLVALDKQVLAMIELRELERKRNNEDIANRVVQNLGSPKSQMGEHKSPGNFHALISSRAIRSFGL